jgi:hypothetical protein
VTKRFTSVLPGIAAFSAVLGTGCDDGHLRGSVSPSSDKSTYLVVADNNGGGCGQIFVDGKAWPHAIGVRGPIRPGEHGISCGDPASDIKFSVPAGVVFTFDYWGP